MARTEARKEFLGDIITAAVEGGTGYWAKVSQYQYVDRFDGERTVRVYTGERVGDETRAVLHEMDEEATANTDDPMVAWYGAYRDEGLVLDLDATARVLRRLIAYYEEAWAKRVAEGRTKHTSLPDTIRMLKAASRENDAGNIDADYADTIAQMGLLGEIRYG